MTSEGSPRDCQNLPGNAKLSAGLRLSRYTLWLPPADWAARLLAHATFSQLAKSHRGALPAFPPVFIRSTMTVETAAKPSVEPTFQITQETLGFAETEATQPATQVEGQFSDHVFQSAAACATCQFSDSPFESFDGSLSDTSLRLSMVRKAKTECQIRRSI